MAELVDPDSIEAGPPSLKLGWTRRATGLPKTVHVKAKVAELVDAHDSKSCIFGCAGSIPAFGTKAYVLCLRDPEPQAKLHLCGALQRHW